MGRLVAHVWGMSETWEPVPGHIYGGPGGGWVPTAMIDPTTPTPEDVPNIHREDPIPYTFPTSAPFNAGLVPCQTPTYDGSGQPTHPAVVDFEREFGPGGKFGGYRFWMCYTPYPGANGQLENPSIVASNNGWDWHDPYGITNPVVPQPAPEDNGFNADGDLSWNPDLARFELIWKWQELGVGVTYRHKSSTDGITWSEPTDLTVAPGSTKPGGLSPALIRTGPNQWVYLTRSGSGVPAGMAVHTAPHPTGPWTGPTPCTITGPLPDTTDENLWHLDAIYDGESFWMLASTHPMSGAANPATGIYPARSADGIDWVFGPKVIADVPGFADGYKYRPTLALHENGQDVRVWYGAMDTMRIWYTVIPRSAFPALP